MMIIYQIFRVYDRAAINKNNFKIKNFVLTDHFYRVILIILAEPSRLGLKILLLIGGFFELF